MGKYIKKELLFMIFLLILNMNRITAIFSVVLLFILGKKNVENSVKVIMYSFFISQLNSSLFNSNISMLRTILNIILMVMILRQFNLIKIIRQNKIIIMLGIFWAYILLTSLFVSWLPLVSMFKVSYFIMGFLSIFIWSKYSNSVKSIQWVRCFFIVIIIINFPFIFLSVGYSVNNRGLNGIFSNPNLLGIVMVLALAIFCYCFFVEVGKYNVLWSVLALIEIMASDSRTSIISSIVILFYVFIMIITKVLNRNKRRIFKFLGIILLSGSILITSVTIYNKEIKDIMVGKFLKGQTAENILFSREGQIATFNEDFNKNPLLGVGFGVDYNESKNKSFELKLSYPMERGNIIFAMLAETGIVGSMLFIGVLFSILGEMLKNNKGKFIIYKGILFIAPLIISLGEMTFFSGNSLGVVQWLLLCLFMNKGIEMERCK